MPVSDTTILRSLKKDIRGQTRHVPVRVAGIDEWAWRKGLDYGTIIVDLERRRVVGLLANRSASSSATWLRAHPELEFVNRDRVGLYADAVRQGAPHARQIADRVHILKNFRETIERQLGRYEAPIRKTDGPYDENDTDATNPVGRPDQPFSSLTKEQLQLGRTDAGRRAQFDQVRALYESGITARVIAQTLGLGIRRVRRWVCRIDFPERNVMAPKLSTPAYFGTFLARSWAAGTTKIRQLFSDIRHRGYTGSYSHVARFVAPWRAASSSKKDIADRNSSDEDARTPPRVRTLDPMTGRQISPVTAAALCVKPRGQMTERQLANPIALKKTSTDFCTMRHLAMRLQALLKTGKVKELEAWLSDAHSSDIHGMRRFVRTVRHDIEAIRNAVLEPWSNGQAAGQINRLKTLKRAMYGRAGIDLLRARMLPLIESDLQRK
jgi:transposase